MRCIFRIFINDRPVILDNILMSESIAAVSVHSCIGVRELKIFGVEMEPIPNSDAYDKLIEDENTLEKSRMADGMVSVLLQKNLNVNALQRDMFKYKIHKQNQARFYIALNFAPKRVHLFFPGEFELVKIKSNGVDLIRIFIADEQVKIHFHPLFNSRKRSMIKE